jgi:hypothetical protein
LLAPCKFLEPRIQGRQPPWVPALRPDSSRTIDLFHTMNLLHTTNPLHTMDLLHAISLLHTTNLLRRICPSTSCTTPAASIQARLLTSAQSSHLGSAHYQPAFHVGSAIPTTQTTSLVYSRDCTARQSTKPSTTTITLVPCQHSRSMKFRMLALSSFNDDDSGVWCRCLRMHFSVASVQVEARKHFPTPTIVSASHHLDDTTTA